MEEQEKYYLSEPASVSDKTGKVRGISLRAYEVTIEEKLMKYFDGTTRTDQTIVPTGKVFWLEKGEIIEKKTKAQLTNKYIGSSYWRQEVSVESSIDKHAGWGSKLYTSPDLAIAAKLLKIKKDRDRIREQAEAILNKLDTETSEYVDKLDKFYEEQPELFI